MKFRELLEIDLEYLKRIVALEEEAFEGQGGVDLWILKALIRYGKVFVLETEEGELVSILEFMQVFQKKKCFSMEFVPEKNIGSKVGRNIC